jgi:hypothetical protein
MYTWPVGDLIAFLVGFLTLEIYVSQNTKVLLIFTLAFIFPETLPIFANASPYI